jgi:uncharacterized protein (UPF0332 family)
MTLENTERQNLIGYRLEQADETVSDVQLLIENNRLRSAVNRVYYGMFYALLALSVSRNNASSKHVKLIGWFNKEFIHTGFIDVKHGKAINKAFNRRTKGDYDVHIKFEANIVREMFGEMKEFIAAIKTFLKENE